ncbi:MAG: hypothetical protein HYU66_08705 [Armatimonadetes bacterium]|nr:hypothetical protein [Armatimonadota bacterium]
MLLDAPETSVLDLLNLAGSITDAAGQPLSGSLLAVLTDPLGRASEASSVADGRFLFADVELPDEGVNHFRLALAREDGVTVLTHEFDIAYRPEDGGSSTIRTVLPRMLSIETVDGLVPLADEGVALPARVSCTLQRENDNPNISLRLFQETEPIGEIRIEGIPPEGGRGSLVDLTVEVTAKNQIRGMAAIRTRDGRIVADQRISVRLEMPEVPSAADLADELGNLQLQWLLNEQGGVDTTNAIAETVATQFAAAARVLDQQPVDRQELHAALRRLRLLVNPPDDDMRPTRREYLECVEQCRAALRETVEKAEAVAAETDEPVPDERKAAHAAELKARAERYLEMVGRLEQEGLKAHGARDRRMLARLHDQLTDIEATVRDRSRPLEAPPNFIGKFMGIMEIMRLRDRLNDAVRHLSQREHVHLEDWSETVSRLEAGRDAAMREVEAIDDELTGEQTMAQVRRLHSRILNALERDIDLLGQDASRV